jgi:hypothetical protein
METQEIFDTAFNGVVKQGGLAVWDNQAKAGICSYRVNDELGVRACGIGHLIDDDTAANWDSRQDSSIFTITCASKRHCLPDKYMWMVNQRKLLVAIQGAHDTASSVHRGAHRLGMQTFCREMQKVAVDFDLTVPEHTQDDSE